MPPATAPAQTSRPSSVGFNLMAIALVAAMAGLGLAYGVDYLSRTDFALPPDQAFVTRGIGGVELSIPAAFFRDPADRTEGFADAIDLVARLPLGPDASERAIDVTLLPRSRARPSAILLDAVYLHQFSPDQLSGPPGLVGKPLLARDGFAGETVWYDPLNVDPFVAKCLAPVAENQRAHCLRTVVRGNVAVVYSFGEEVLASWRRFDDAADAWLAEMGIR